MTPEMFTDNLARAQDQIKALLARAEKAERERDEAWNAAIEAAADEAAIGSAVAASRIRALKRGSNDD